MDNVTHTLTGLAVAHAALYLRGRRLQAAAMAADPPASRSATLLISALANNLPDLDFLYRGITPGRLGYLLHHRGHTHTLLATVPLALFSLACVGALLRLHGQRLPRATWGFLLGLAVLGGLLHVTMDFGNNYGVHPFWPFDDHWYYGDAIFIVEPWLMIALAGSVFGASRSRLARALMGLILVGLLSYAWRVAYGPSPLLAPGLAALLTLGAVGWLGWMHWGSPSGRRASALVVLGLLLSAQLFGRAAARARVSRALASSLGFELVSVASTPSPGNPLCWSLLAVGRSSGADAGASRDQYVVQQAFVSAWPALWAPSACGAFPTGTTAPLVPPARPLPEEAGVHWGREFRAPLAELRALARRDCVARGFLRFARVPFWLQEQGRARLIGDLRFDRSPAVEFAELPLEPGASCPRLEPPWRPPLGLLDALLP
ncbi:MAG: metal-dependent hydrolase [Deltaproteobacteria bacterium]